MSDYLIKNATIVDGTGNDSYRGSILIKDDRISKIIRGDGKRSERLPRAKVVCDAQGKIASPGFIDIHSHNDWLLPDPLHIEVMEPLIRQGVTTVVTGQCGFSPAPLFADKIDEINVVRDILCDNAIPNEYPTMNTFFEHLERDGIAVNMAHFIGHATLKGTLKGASSSERFNINDLCRLEYSIEESFDAGAFGISFGLGYTPGMFSSHKELQWFANFAGRENAVLAAHLKAYSTISPCYPFIPGGTPHNVIALRDMVSIAKRADAALQISHLIFPGESTQKTAERVLKIVEKEYASGFDISFDAFPYTAGNTTIAAVLPYWFLNNFEENIHDNGKLKRVKFMFKISKRLLKFDIGDIQLLKAYHQPYEKYEGMNFHEIARNEKRELLDTYIDFVKSSNAKARILIGNYYDSETPDSVMARILSHPLCRFETDTLITRRGVQNPATYGNFPKIISKFTRESPIMKLEEAIHKMTAASARKIGIRKRGEITEGNYADLVIFDYDKINENTQGTMYPPGVEYVFINGKPILEKNRIERKKLSGRLLRRNDQ
jgi:N-acyl-D-amino-acid deacylase